jgi:ABC-type sugar transport system substrate-binding protein
MKKNKTVSLLGVSLLVLSSCKSSSSKVGIFIYNGNDTFITELTGCMKTDLKSYKTQIFDASESQVTQNEQILNCLNGNYSYFLINTVDRLASSAIIEKCSSKKHSYHLL